MDDTPSALARRHKLARSLRGKVPGDGRKTYRRRAKSIAPHDMPEWCITCPLPAGLSFAVTPDASTGIIGIGLRQDPARGLMIEAKGRDTQWLLGQIAAYLGTIKNGWQGRLALRAQRDAYPGCTEGAPLRPAQEWHGEAYLTAGAALVVPRRLKDPLILKV